jgi:hypothetical protein
LPFGKCQLSVSGLGESRFTACAWYA